MARKLTVLSNVNDKSGARGVDAKYDRPQTVLLVAPSYGRGVNTEYFPIGLGYISSFIRKQGHRVIPLNMNHLDAKAGRAKIQELLKTEPIDVIGISGLTTSFVVIRELVRFIREYSKAKVVLGGGITSSESEIVMRAIRPDYMVVGEGELVFSELLAAISNGSDASEIGGLWIWRDGEPFSTGTGFAVDDLDSLPDPDFEHFGMQTHLDLQNGSAFSYSNSVLDMGREMPITASRSCPFRCTFCYHAGMGKYKKHSIPQVVEYIERCLNRFHVEHISIYDELFSANRSRLVEFCELLNQKKINRAITWFCQLRVDQIDQELLNLMAESGCVRISYGFESGSDIVLKSMQKKIKAASIARAVTMTRKAKIGIQANFLYGDIAETEATLQESLEFQRKNELWFCDWSAVIPYAGTSLYRNAQSRGLISDPERFIAATCDTREYLWNHMINMTSMDDAVFFEKYVDLRELNDINHRHRLASISDACEVDQRTSRMNIKCPGCHWEEQNVEVPYPPEEGEIEDLLDSVIGVKGLNIECPGCRRRMHLKAADIPHVKKVYDRFEGVLERLRSRQTPVVVLPAMDRYFHVFTEDVNLEKLNVVASLDTREHCIGRDFMGVKVARLEKANVERDRDFVYLILPWMEWRSAKNELLAHGVSESNILSWNECFDPRRDLEREFCSDESVAEAV